MLKYLAVIVCLYSTILYADNPPAVLPEEKVEFILPVIKKTEDVPPVSPDAPVSLLPNKLYVVRRSAAFFVKCYPEGLLSVKPLAGPLTAYGQFVDGEGEEDRTFTEPFLNIIKAIPGKSGRVTVVLTPKGTAITDEASIVSILIDIGVAPQPPPVPVPIPPIPGLLTTAQKVTQALTGSTAKSDAVILVAAAEAVQASMSKYTNAAQLQTHWGQLLAANKWVKGSRPQITALIEAEIPPTPGAAPPLTDADRTRISALFKAIEDGASEVLK